MEFFVAFFSIGETFQLTVESNYKGNSTDSQYRTQTSTITKTPYI
jgi:hypothetical protein